MEPEQTDDTPVEDKTKQGCVNEEVAPPTFAKSSLLMLLVAVAIYAYQVRASSYTS